MKSRERRVSQDVTASIEAAAITAVTTTSSSGVSCEDVAFASKNVRVASGSAMVAAKTGNVAARKKKEEEKKKNNHRRCLHHHREQEEASNVANNGDDHGVCLAEAAAEELVMQQTAEATTLVSPRDFVSQTPETVSSVNREGHRLSEPCIEAVSAHLLCDSGAGGSFAVAAAVVCRKASSAMRLPDGSAADSKQNMGRALRPRQRVPFKATPKRSGPFQQVVLCDADGKRIVGRRLKVFWPLDSKWYYGEVKAYNSVRRLHKIVYDDRDEEWLKLSNEQFKLQVLEGEVFGAQVSVLAPHSSEHAVYTRKTAQASASRYRSSLRGEDVPPLRDAVLVAPHSVAHPDLELPDVAKLLREDVRIAAGPDDVSTEKLALDPAIAERMVSGSVIAGKQSSDRQIDLSDWKPGVVVSVDQDALPDQGTSSTFRFEGSSASACESGKSPSFACTKGTESVKPGAVLNNCLADLCDVLFEARQSGVLEEKPAESVNKEEVATESNSADHYDPEQMEFMPTHVVPGLVEVDKSANPLLLPENTSDVCFPSLSPLVGNIRIASAGSATKSVENVLVTTLGPLNDCISLCTADATMEDGLSLATEGTSAVSSPNLATSGKNCHPDLALLTTTIKSKQADIGRARDKESLGEVILRQTRKRKHLHQAELQVNVPGDLRTTAGIMGSICDTRQPQSMRIVRECRSFTKYMGTYLVDVSCLICLQHYECLKLSSTDMWKTVPHLKLSIFLVSRIDGLGQRVKQALLTGSWKKGFLISGVLAKDRALSSGDLSLLASYLWTCAILGAGITTVNPDPQGGGDFKDIIHQEQGTYMDPCNSKKVGKQCLIKHDEQAQSVYFSLVDGGQVVCSYPQSPSKSQAGNPELETKECEGRKDHVSAPKPFEAIVVEGCEDHSTSEKSIPTRDFDETLSGTAHELITEHLGSCFNASDVGIALGDKRHNKSKEACPHSIARGRYSCGSRITGRSRKHTKQIRNCNLKGCATGAECKIHEMSHCDPVGISLTNWQRFPAVSNHVNARESGGIAESSIAVCEGDGVMRLENMGPKQVGSELPKVNVVKLQRCSSNKTLWQAAVSSCVQGSKLSTDSTEPLTPASTADRKRSFGHDPKSFQLESPEENGESTMYAEDSGTFNLETSISPGAQVLNPRGKEFSSNCRAFSTQEGTCISKKRQRIGSINLGFSDGFARHPMDQSDLQGPEFACGGCSANVLIVEIDRGWREIGASVELQLCQGQDWMLVVSLDRGSVYTHKAEQSITSGTTNCYTHAMMWKGGKRWSLEFVDRKQWQVFKEMHHECFQRNARAASVRHIPIPGVTYVGDSVTKNPGSQFMRPLAKYIGGVDDEVNMALANTQVVYDMDSEDEHWLAQVNNEKDCIQYTLPEPFVAEETLERLMDKLEKGSFIKQQDSVELISAKFATELCQGLASEQVIKVVHAYWSGKRGRKGIALVCQFQPAPWEMYQKQMQIWQLQFMQLQQQSLTASKQQLLQQCRRPPLFAFCLRPRGLEVKHVLQKQRSHRKRAVGGSAMRHWISVGSINGSLNSPSKQHCCIETVDGLYLGTSNLGLTEAAQAADLADPLKTSVAESDMLGCPKPVSEPGSLAISERPLKKFCKSKKVGRKVRRLHQLAGAQEMHKKLHMSSNMCTVNVPDVAVAAVIARSNAEAAHAHAQALYSAADAAMHKAVVAVIAAGGFQVAEDVAVKEERMGNGGDICPSFGSWWRAVSNSVSNNLKPQGNNGRPVLVIEGDDALLPIASWSQELGAGLGTHLLDKDALSMGTARTKHGEGTVNC